MLHRNIANRYANALFALARDAGRLEKIEADFPRVADTFAGDADFHGFINHPAIINAEKKKVIASMYSGKIDDMLFDFINLVIDKRREAYISLIWEGFRDRLMEHRKSAEAIVETPYELSADLSGALAAKLGEVTGKTIIIKQHIEPALIGGIRIRLGDRVVDGSIVHRMQQMKQALESARV